MFKKVKGTDHQWWPQSRFNKDTHIISSVYRVRLKRKKKKSSVVWAQTQSVIKKVKDIYHQWWAQSLFEK